MKKMKKIIYLGIAIIFTMASCDKESETGGCLDPQAINYQSWVDYDDRSCLYECDDQYATNYLVTTTYPVCEYEADVVFFLDEFAAQEFTNQNIPYLDVYVGNTLAGSMPTDTAFVSTITCEDTNPEPVHFIYQWENEQSTDMTWTVRDGTGEIWYNGTDQLLCNNCRSIQLTWSMIKAYRESH
tara:strand:- start:7335 stop:7886 length:552 start_codon:yes stop_codon:yes gene_type:complete